MKPQSHGSTPLSDQIMMRTAGYHNHSLARVSKQTHPQPHTRHSCLPSSTSHDTAATVVLRYPSRRTLSHRGLASVQCACSARHSCLTSSTRHCRCTGHPAAVTTTLVLRYQSRPTHRRITPVSHQPQGTAGVRDNHGCAQVSKQTSISHMRVTPVSHRPNGCDRHSKVQAP